MQLTKRHGTTVSLALAGHPLRASTVAVGLAAAAALSGRPLPEVGLVALSALCGMLAVAWFADAVDRGRDRRSGALGGSGTDGVDRGTEVFALAVAVLALVPLSIANGTYAGLALLGAVGSLWAYHLWFERSWLSWLPYAVAVGLLPAFLAYGGAGGGVHGAPPTWTMTALAALLGVGLHVLEALPVLVQDDRNGLRHLPLRIALRVGAPRLLWLARAWTALAGVAIVVVGLTVGLRR